MATPTAIVAYLALFVLVGFVFLFVNLLVGRFLRPSEPSPEKGEIYECGEPTIGSSFVQFDLRFYVVALVFIVFDVEVAFLFPLATVFGKATNLADPQMVAVAADGGGQLALTADGTGLYRELGLRAPDMANVGGPQASAESLQRGSRQLALATFVAINVFFVVLLIGFAYEWKTGAFDWVRAVTRERSLEVARAPPSVLSEEPPILSP